MFRWLRLIALIVVAALVCGQGFDAQAASGRIRQRTAAPDGGPVILWVLSDSIGHGAEPVGPPYVGSFTYRGGWRTPLFQAMTTASTQPSFLGTLLNADETPPVTTAGVGHNGNNGASTTSWIAAFAATYASAFPVTPPHIVIITLGANDANTVGAGQNVGAIVDLCAAAAPRAVILVGNVLPRSGIGNDAVNAQIASEVASRRAKGMNVVIVDQASAVALGDIPDGVHASSGGYARLGEVWKLAVLPWVTR